MTGQDAAKILFNCATFLDMEGANRYRVAAYRRAALIMQQLADLAPRLVANEEALRALGFGTRLRRKLQELFTTGELHFYDELVAARDEPIGALLRIPGIGPKTALRLYRELGISTPAALTRAARAGEIHPLKGFGTIREARWAALPVEMPRVLPPAEPALPRAA